MLKISGVLLLIALGGYLLGLETPAPLLPSSAVDTAKSATHPPIF